MTIEIVQDDVAPATYERIINAALQVGRSKFEFAEALILDIPEAARDGKGDGSIQASLEQVAQDIVDAGGDEIAWRTLRSYRQTAIWVLDSNGAILKFRWRTGSSFTAHTRAALGGMDYDEFAKVQLTSREVQAALGNKVSYGVKQTVDTMTPTEKADIIAALVKDNTEGVAAIVQTQRIADLPLIHTSGPDGKGCGIAPTVGAVSTSLDNYDRIAALKEVIGGTRQWMSTQLTKWGRAMFTVKGVMNEEDRNVIAGYYLDIAEQWTDAATKLKDDEWTQ